MKHHEDLKEIFGAGLARVNPYEMILNAMTLEGDILRIKTEQHEQTWDLTRFDRLVVLGAGKASARMAQAVESILGDRIAESLVAVKYGHVEELKHIRLMETAHPVPDNKSVEAGRELLRLANSADEKTLFINVISGGGSAILAAPLTAEKAGVELSLEDLQKTTEVLLACGAEIQEMNCLRKHLSSIKGGRLSQAAYPATSINLILSDVVGDSLDAIASGLTAPDSTTYDDVTAIIKKYNIAGKLPSVVIKAVEAGASDLIPETPKAGDKVFGKVANILIGTNYAAVAEAGRKAKELGYNTVLLSSQMTGEASELASMYLGIARDIKRYDTLEKKPACVIAGGESTVTLKGRGKGGRNQEMALAFLTRLAEAPQGCEGIYFLSSATDGNDGPTDAAGGFASLEVLESVKEKGLDPQEYLSNNDAYALFDACGFLYRTGPTNTNVCDLQVLIVV